MPMAAGLTNAKNTYITGPMIIIVRCCCVTSAPALRPMICFCWNQLRPAITADQQEVGERLDEPVGERRAGAPREVDAEGVHVRLADERLVEGVAVVEVLGAEALAHRRGRDDAHLHQPHLQAGELVRAGQPANHVEQDREDRRLDQQRKATTNGVDVVLLVERHHLFVELLAVVLVLDLQLPDFRLEPLHLDHRPGALEGQRGRDQHDDAGQKGDRHRVVRHQLVEEVE